MKIICIIDLQRYSSMDEYETVKQAAKNNAYHKPSYESDDPLAPINKSYPPPFHR